MKYMIWGITIGVAIVAYSISRQLEQMHNDIMSIQQKLDEVFPDHNIFE